MKRVIGLALALLAIGCSSANLKGYRVDPADPANVGDNEKECKEFRDRMSPEEREANKNENCEDRRPAGLTYYLTKPRFEIDVKETHAKAKAVPSYDIRMIPETDPEHRYEVWLEGGSLSKDVFTLSMLPDGRVIKLGVTSEPGAVATVKAVGKLIPAVALALKGLPAAGTAAASKAGDAGLIDNAVAGLGLVDSEESMARSLTAWYTGGQTTALLPIDPAGVIVRILRAVVAQQDADLETAISAGDLGDIADAIQVAAAVARVAASFFGDTFPTELQGDLQAFHDKAATFFVSRLASTDLSEEDREVIEELIFADLAPIAIYAELSLTPGTGLRAVLLEKLTARLSTAIVEGEKKTIEKVAEKVGLLARYALVSPRLDIYAAAVGHLRAAGADPPADLIAAGDAAATKKALQEAEGAKKITTSQRDHGLEVAKWYEDSSQPRPGYEDSHVTTIFTKTLGVQTGELERAARGEDYDEIVERSVMATAVSRVSAKFLTNASSIVTAATGAMASAIEKAVFEDAEMKSNEERPALALYGMITALGPVAAAEAKAGAATKPEARVAKSLKALQAAAASDYADYVINGACRTNADCGDKQYCGKAVGSCGDPGICRSKPQVCLEGSKPVCGCDAQDYDNACKAAMAGESVLHAGSCTRSSGRAARAAGGTRWTSDSLVAFDAAVGRLFEYDAQLQELSVQDRLNRLETYLSRLVQASEDGNRSKAYKDYRAEYDLLAKQISDRLLAVLKSEKKTTKSLPEATEVTRVFEKTCTSPIGSEQDLYASSQRLLRLADIWIKFGGREAVVFQDDLTDETSTVTSLACGG